MARITSIETYNRIKNNGLLSKRRLEIYEILYKGGVMTSGEVFAEIQKTREVSGLSQSRARFTELRELGVIQEKGVKICNVTSNKVIAWETTDGLPVKPEKKTKKQKKEELLSMVEELGREINDEHKEQLREIYRAITRF